MIDSGMYMGIESVSVEIADSRRRTYGTTAHKRTIAVEDITADSSYTHITAAGDVVKLKRLNKAYAFVFSSQAV